MTNHEAAEMIRNDMKLHHDYLSGQYRKALNMAIDALLKEQEAKQPIHVYEEFQEHDWCRNEDGEIDEFAFYEDYHNGPICKRCDYSFCIWCDPNGWNKKPCVIDEYKCPRCEQRISKGTKFCSNCGQAMQWDDKIDL